MAGHSLSDQMLNATESIPARPRATSTGAVHALMQRLPDLCGHVIKEAQAGTSATVAVQNRSTYGPIVVVAVCVQTESVRMLATDTWRGSSAGVPG